ncbi:MAG: porin family protein [Dysgonamonadaceae bacterium]|nr:porin family protein [Dysgonamonadaceae bacterium]
MKKLKLSLVIAFLGMISIVSAQTASLSIKAGLNMSNYYGDDLTDRNMKPGFHAGLGADLELTPNMFVQTGLFFSTKGAKFSDTGEGDWIDANITANYLQIPVHFAYKIDVTPGTKVVLHAGPYLAYGVSGKMKLGSLEVNTFDKDLGFKPFDAGLGLGVGAEFGVILVDLGWDMGLTNISRASSGNIKNQNAYLSLGYRF